ncbi:MAG: hypothetical protein ACLQIB_09785 [Isosphaeraceae bacterium]
MAIGEAQNDVGECQDDRLERTHVIEPDGVEQHGDEMNGTGESDENAPNEANFEETTSIVEPKESIQVTVNSAALSGPGSKSSRGG